MSHANRQNHRRVILIELNEITWRLLDPLLNDGSLPTFAELIRRGARGTPIAPEVPPDLDPWISWMTVYTGRPAQEHGVKFLEQPPETVRGPKIWDIASKAGKTIGVFGSTMSWPPRNDVKGFWVPGPFSPGPETFPNELRPIQELNLTYTRAHTPLDTSKKPSKLALLIKLSRLGLRPSTIVGIGGYFARRLIGSAKEWEKVSLQPLINLDFFTYLWRRYRPSFATFHSNHVAHYQHRFWRSTDPTPFLEKPSADEVKQFGGAIKYGYQVADRMLRRVLELADQDTTIIIASGLGQQPYVVEEFREGRSVVRMNDVTQVLNLVGVLHGCRPYSVMAPQWNLEFSSADAQKTAVKGLEAAYYGDPTCPLFTVAEVGNTLCLNIRQKLPRPINWKAPCVFPTTGRSATMEEICSEKDATPKQGYHEQAGVVIMAGSGIRSGVEMRSCSTLDLAPTILSLLGIQIPTYMTGKVLEDALEPIVQPVPKDKCEDAGLQPTAVGL